MYSTCNAFVIMAVGGFLLVMLGMLMLTYLDGGFVESDTQDKANNNFFGYKGEILGELETSFIYNLDNTIFVNKDLTGLEL